MRIVHIKSTALSALALIFVMALFGDLCADSIGAQTPTSFVSHSVLAKLRQVA